jgi:hypothetical protein
MTPRYTCHCGLPLVATAETTPGTPRRRWVCTAGHGAERDDSEPPAPTTPPPPPPGQLGLL